MGNVALAYLSSGLAIGLAAIGAALGIGLIGAKSIESVTRQPEQLGTIRTLMFICIAFVESICLYGLLIAILLIFTAK
ncbi:MAG: F0F1 ATP synthase subunit C [Candidatus Margulisiibacteriota bacterium]|nr:MAG: ATP synthase F0 subunit C [Candidatus Margulisbacteria bacterium GWD2_39_127]OGI02666.1 MAG: ATP synthase F0 subunit C [Candidatus Margulisbacteria bacterium GWF2_38_17]OGI05949.1 MAG: ATP synthase F0 subunit C [Candidatus Margulisbacteria bacterium GWE2_39_32]PZM79997.1 MAG: F0F1 ATP synthase subunit C [Candidatus Margulisiibacteriota bacterium]HAR62598.1 F0F1 ATP synthase subunit C [Candidatus Margulisiibacteriota bacterium]